MRPRADKCLLNCWWIRGLSSGRQPPPPAATASLLPARPNSTPACLAQALVDRGAVDRLEQASEQGMVRRWSQRASRAATTGCPGPVSSPTAHARPVIAISMASAGPETSGPEPWLQSRSEVVRCSTASDAPRRQFQAAHTGVQDPAQPFSRNLAWQTERSADVLMMDGDIEQGKPSSEGCGQSLRPQVSTQPVEELVGTQQRKFVDAGLVDVDDPTADGTAKHPKWTDAVEAHDVSDHVTDTPALAQRRAFPLLGHQRRQKIRQVGSLGRRHLESVHGIPSQLELLEGSLPQTRDLRPARNARGRPDAPHCIDVDKTIGHRQRTDISCRRGPLRRRRSRTVAPRARSARTAGPVCAGRMPRTTRSGGGSKGSGVAPGSCQAARTGMASTRPVLCSFSSWPASMKALAQ